MTTEISLVSASNIQHKRLQKSRAFGCVTILEVVSKTINTPFTIFRVGKLKNSLNLWPSPFHLNIATVSILGLAFEIGYILIAVKPARENTCKNAGFSRVYVRSNLERLNELPQSWGQPELLGANALAIVSYLYQRFVPALLFANPNRTTNFCIAP